MTTLARPRRTHYVDLMRGYARRTGKSEGRAFDSIQDAVDAADPGDLIKIAGHSEAYDDDAADGYNEEVTIPITLPGLILMACVRDQDWIPGGSVFIAPQGGNKTALTVNAMDVVLRGVGCDGEGTGFGLAVAGGRLRALQCKLEGGAAPLHLIGGLSPGAGLDPVGGADHLFDQCEFAWAARGVRISQGQVGAVTQTRIRRSRFHNITTAHFAEGDGVAAGLFRNLLVEHCSFEGDEDAADPTHYFKLDGSNSNTGQVRRCTFPVALDSAKNLVSTGMKWIANYHPGGLSTGQPS